MKILLVEDEAIVAIDIAMMLEDNDYDILGPASTVVDALLLLDDCLPDIALLDVNLQGCSVVPVAERCKRLGIPFLLISAYKTFGFDKTGILKSAENIGKPVFEHQLIDGLQRAIKLREG